MQRTELPGVHRCAARQAIITNLRLVLQEAHEIQKGANSSLSIGAIEHKENAAGYRRPLRNVSAIDRLSDSC